MRDPSIPKSIAVDDYTNQKAKSEKRSVIVIAFAVPDSSISKNLIGIHFPGALVSYKFSQIEKGIRNEFLRVHGQNGQLFLKSVEKGQHGQQLLDDSEQKMLNTCLSFKTSLKNTLHGLANMRKSSMSAELHNENLKRMDAKGVYVVETDKASDAMAFACRFRELRSTIDTKLVFWQSGIMHNIKCTLESSSEFIFGIVDPSQFLGTVVD